MNVVSADKFKKLQMEREYDRLLKEYYSKPEPYLKNESLQKIASLPGIKAIFTISHGGMLDSHCLNSGDEILAQLESLDFDYDWISSKILRLHLSWIIYMDVYFRDELSETEIEELTVLLERDVLDNYKIMDDNVTELFFVNSKLEELQENYYSAYGKPLITRQFDD